MASKKNRAKKRKAISRKRYFIEIIEYNDGTKEKRSKVRGFHQYELVGILQVELRDALEIKGENHFKKD